jgi:RimJ/RimL family protein N-acetyltransferase
MFGGDRVRRNGSIVRPVRSRLSAVAIRIEPVKLAWIEALSVSDEAFGERFGLEVAPGWVGFPEALQYALEAARSNDEDEWGSYLFFDDDVLVGFGGFKGPPRDGEVEIGYAVAPSWRGRGVATQATRLFIERAERAGVSTVIAHTLAEPNPSTAVLERCGFERTATISDPDEGVDEPVWRWERPACGGSSIR